MREFVVTNAPKEFDLRTTSVLSENQNVRLVHVFEPAQLTQYKGAGFLYEHVIIGKIFSHEISMSLMIEALNDSLETIEDLRSDAYYGDYYRSICSD
jgi:hypothetical protein